MAATGDPHEPPSAPQFLYCLTGQAAAVLGVNPLTIQRWVKSGRLRGWRVGSVTLIARSDVEREVLLRRAR